VLGAVGHSTGLLDALTADCTAAAAAAPERLSAQLWPLLLFAGLEAPSLGLGALQLCASALALALVLVAPLAPGGAQEVGTSATCDVCHYWWLVAGRRTRDQKENGVERAKVTRHTPHAGRPAPCSCLVDGPVQHVPI
jgi:hypothetical protein